MIISKRKRNYIGQWFDITEHKHATEEHKRLQTQVDLSDEMESIGRLAGGVAHNFNNMLCVILGYTQMALDTTEPNSLLNHHLQQVLVAGQRSAHITQQLLAFASKQTIAPKVLNLNEVIELEMLQKLRILVGEHIDLVWKPKANRWRVKIDRSQLADILTNLVSNAFDAINGAGNIIIETDNTTLETACYENHPGMIPGEFVSLMVGDNGSGMDKATMQNLFKPFFTTKEVGKGIGLGLATVYGIVKQNKGFIYAFSEPGLGAAFKIYFPRHKDQAT